MPSRYEVDVEEGVVVEGGSGEGRGGRRRAPSGSQTPVRAPGKTPDTTSTVEAVEAFRNG